MKAGDYSMAGPASLAQDLPAMPQTDSKSDEFFVLRNQQNGKPIANRSYKASTETGKVLEGISDAQGRTQLVKGAMPEGVQITVLPSAKT